MASTSVTEPDEDSAMKPALLSAFLLLAAQPSLAQNHQHHAPAAESPYAGQETRAIKSLSDDDVAELRRGGGWGLAKAAELNGMPGPAHLLELKDEIPLSAEQVAKIDEIFATMQRDAIAEGALLIDAETRLETAFRDRAIDDVVLKALLAEIEGHRSRLRYIHLATHLSTPALLTDAQIARYNSLRGYGADPCAAVPAGHDPAMWRKHNGCE